MFKIVDPDNNDVMPDYVIDLLCNADDSFLTSTSRSHFRIVEA